MRVMASQINGVSIVCSKVCSGADQWKYQTFESQAFLRESTSDRWIPLTKGLQRGKCLHLMTSLCKYYLIANQFHRKWYFIRATNQKNEWREIKLICQWNMRAISILHVFIRQIIHKCSWWIAVTSFFGETSATVWQWIDRNLLDCLSIACFIWQYKTTAQRGRSHKCN